MYSETWSSERVSQWCGFKINGGFDVAGGLCVSCDRYVESLENRLENMEKLLQRVSVVINYDLNVWFAMVLTRAAHDNVTVYAVVS